MQPHCDDGERAYFRMSPVAHGPVVPAERLESSSKPLGCNNRSKTLISQ